MRIFLLSLLTILFSCQNPVEKTIENAKQPELHPTSNRPIANAQQLLHSFILHKNIVTIKMNTTDTSIAYEALPNYIELNNSELTKQRLNIVVSSNATYQQTTDVLDQMTINKIQDYVLLRLD